jgi:hypothetical protein
MINRSLCRAWILAVMAAAAIGGAFAQSRVPEVDAVLNDLHAAASAANFDRYFSHFAPNAVFLGTDPAERWTTPEFMAYARKRFGWTYVPKQRHIFLSGDKSVAWFDETLESPKYGLMRGTGVLVRSGATWKLAQYNLEKPIPNALFPRVVQEIRTGSDSVQDSRARVR